jgi:hypothetical protein
VIAAEAIPSPLLPVRSELLQERNDVGDVIVLPAGEGRLGAAG